MSIIDFATAPSRRQAFSSDVSRLKTGALRALRLLLAGMHASKEDRHLNGMTDQQLATLGLSRGRIDQEVRRRHLADLGEGSARPD